MALCIAYNVNEHRFIDSFSVVASHLCKWSAKSMEDRLQALSVCDALGALKRNDDAAHFGTTYRDTRTVIRPIRELLTRYTCQLSEAWTHKISDTAKDTFCSIKPLHTRSTHSTLERIIEAVIQKGGVPRTDIREERGSLRRFSFCCAIRGASTWQQCLWPNETELIYHARGSAPFALVGKIQGLDSAENDRDRKLIQCRPTHMEREGGGPGGVIECLGLLAPLIS